jgi:hypothetical protein
MLLRHSPALLLLLTKKGDMVRILERFLLSLVPVKD